MFEKILVANRGEIAVRIIRACKELNIHTIAVYSEADLDSLHTSIADEAICIGPAQSAASYLHIPSIIGAAEIADVEAIHPGYGFLAENSHFAEICESCNIKFIGPSSKSIKLMGDKASAKELMKKAGVPIVPGSDGAVETWNDALKIAKKIGYPVIIKATAGGGGRGLRTAHNDMSLSSAFHMAKAEAEVAFNNGEIYIEKYIEEPRHVEIQILADLHGNIIHLNERDCTIQRRHQKLIEESPSPGVDARLRAKMGKAAIKAAEAADYANAGTVEFLMDKSGAFYFIEMNTRIQVEHPVTECVTGIDLVKEQIKIAAGGKLKLEQKDIKIKGWALECRINAEDWERDFMPSPGKVDGYYTPGGPGIRIDSHIYSGYTIPSNYDSLISKIIATGNTREEAIRCMLKALDEYKINGVKTTIPFHIKLLTHPDFIQGNYATNFVDELMEWKG